MCGICGAAAMHGRLLPELSRAMRDMTGALRHRGPDGDGFFNDDHAALGHRRLAIIDRERGAQPLSNEDGTCWIVFNGEVYNHHALRADLVARGHRFRTHSDTEAIVHAYEEYGAGCVELLEGMFAFAIYDQTRREIFLARDRIGKKPLFYAVFGDALHFASEIKALRRSPLWDGTIDLDNLEGYLSLGYFIAPHTVYRHVRKLEPGHWLRLRDGRVEVRKYWDIEEFDSDDRGEAPLVGEIETTLRSTVNERLESEVPLGAFLSGGIDSGLVVSFMAETLGSSLLTASVGFDEAEHNELEAAGLTARHFQTQHFDDVLTPRLGDVLDRVVQAFDEPFADASAIPTYYVSKSARQHVTVALSGDGGDEVFGGYEARYVPHAVEAMARPVVSRLGAAPVVGWAGTRWPRSRSLPRALRLGTILENLARDPADAYYADLCFLKPFEARRAMGREGTRSVRESPVYESVTAPYRRCRSASPLQRAQYADLKVYLPNDVLVKVDRMSMLNSLEVRCPLLDRRIVELAFRIPSRSKMPRLRAKHLLKTLASRRLPPALLRLPKHGFTAPVGEWIAGEYAEQFNDEVFGRDSGIAGLVDLGVIGEWLHEHRTGQIDRSNALWAIWMLERWHRASRPEPVAQTVTA